MMSDKNPDDPATSTDKPDDTPRLEVMREIAIVDAEIGVLEVEVMRLRDIREELKVELLGRAPARRKRGTKPNPKDVVRWSKEARVRIRRKKAKRRKASAKGGAAF